MTPLALLGKRLPWSDEAGVVIKGFLRMPSPLCVAVGEVIRQMSVENVSCHCDCQDIPFRFYVQYRFGRPALVRDMACRRGLLHVRSLDPGLDPQLLDDMVHHFEVDRRSVIYTANVKDEARGRFLDGVALAETLEDLGRFVDMATLRHAMTFYS